jgi:hypothetical protein
MLYFVRIRNRHVSPSSYSMRVACLIKPLEPFRTAWRRRYLKASVSQHSYNAPESTMFHVFHSTIALMEKRKLGRTVMYFVTCRKTALLYVVSDQKTALPVICDLSEDSSSCNLWLVRRQLFCNLLLSEDSSSCQKTALLYFVTYQKTALPVICDLLEDSASVICDLRRRLFWYLWLHCQ